MNFRRRVAQIAPNSIVANPKYQRPLKPSWVRTLARMWKDEQCQTVDVAERDGRYSCLDGQHRVAALKSLGLGDRPIRCEVYSTTTVAEEAALFRAFNRHKSLTALEQFYARLAEGDPLAAGVQRVVQGLGLKLPRAAAGSPNLRSVNAVAVVETVYEKDGRGDLLRQVLSIAKNAWGDEPSSFQGPILLGLADVLVANPKWDINRLISQLQKTGNGPRQIMADATNLRDATARRLPECVGVVLDARYRGRRKLRGVA